MGKHKWSKVYCRLATAFAALVLVLGLSPAALAAADTDENTPRLVQQPDQLVLQLGTRWAGVEFELRTDAGAFPVPVVVDEFGVLTMDLGGSTTYTLSCLNSETPIPDPGVELEPDEEQPVQETPVPTQQPSPAPAQDEHISIFSVILFLVGVALAAGGGVAFFFAKRSQTLDYDDWEDEEDEL